MSDGFEQAFTIALDDLNNDRLAPPEDYLTMVPRARHDEFVERLTAAMAERGPIEGVDELSCEAHRRALAALAQVRGSGGPSGILPGALITLRRARGIDRDDVLDHLASEFSIGPNGRPTLRRYYHRLETGGLLGTKVSHRLLRSIATRLGASGDDFIAAIQPIGEQSPLIAAPSMGRGAGSPRKLGNIVNRSDPAADPRPDPDVELVERLFCGGADA
jgi:hypothetical protein